MRPDRGARYFLITTARLIDLTTPEMMTLTGLRRPGRFRTLGRPHQSTMDFLPIAFVSEISSCQVARSPLTRAPRCAQPAPFLVSFFTFPFEKKIRGALFERESGNGETTAAFFSFFPFFFL